MSGAHRFARQLLAASVLVTAVGLLGVAIGHSGLGQVVAPHFRGVEQLQIVSRDGSSFVKIENGPPGHQQVSFRRLPKLVTSLPPGRGGTIARGAGSPSDFSDWMPVAQILALVMAIALLIAALDHLRRAARRRRRALPSVS